MGEKEQRDNIIYNNVGKKIHFKCISFLLVNLVLIQHQIYTYTYIKIYNYDIGPNIR